MQEVWLHFKWAPGSDRVVILGAHRTEEDARLDCPADVWGEDADWIVEGVAPLARDPCLLAGLEDHVELMKAVQDIEPT